MAGGERPTKRQKVSDHGEWKGKGKRKASDLASLHLEQILFPRSCSVFKSSCKLNTTPVIFRAELENYRSSTDGIIRIRHERSTVLKLGVRRQMSARRGCRVGMWGSLLQVTRGVKRGR